MRQQRAKVDIGHIFVFVLGIVQSVCTACIVLVVKTVSDVSRFAINHTVYSINNILKKTTKNSCQRYLLIWLPQKNGENFSHFRYLLLGIMKLLLRNISHTLKLR